MAEPTQEELRQIAIIKSVMNDQLQPIRDEITTTASRLHLAQEKLSANLKYLQREWTHLRTCLAPQLHQLEDLL